MTEMAQDGDDEMLPVRQPSKASSISFVLTGLGFAALAFYSAKPPHLSLLLFVPLLTLSWYDFHFFRLPNLITLALAGASIAPIVSLPNIVLQDHLIGGLVGLMLFPAINALYFRLRGRSGIGMGDTKLLGGIGLWLGWWQLPMVLLIASASALIVASLQFVANGTEKGKHLVKKPLPFGLYLSFATWLVWLFPQT